MKYCSNCGKELIDEAVVCTGCGVQQTPVGSLKDKGGFGWGLLGFLVPIAGLLLYLLWQNTHPKNAKAAGKGALWYVIISAILVVLYISFIIFLIVSGIMNA